MSFFLLKPNWLMRGYTNKPFVLLNANQEQNLGPQIISEKLWLYILLFDGKCDIEKDKVVEAFIKGGFITEVPEDNEGLLPIQEYQTIPYPLRTTVMISLTGKCNLNCIHCFQGSDAKRKVAKEDLNLEQLYNILEQLPGVGVTSVNLTGGEPLVFPYFKEIVTKISNLNLSIDTIYTNGMLITDELLDFIKSSNQKPMFAISFDGLGTHNIIRNNEKAEELAIKAMKKVLDHGFKLQCNIQVNKLTTPRLKETCRFLDNLGVSLFWLIRTSESPRFIGSKMFGTCLSIEEYHNLSLDIAETFLSEKLKAELVCIFSLNIASIENRKRSYFLRKQKRIENYNGKISCLEKCGRASNQFYIEHTGLVWPCEIFEGVGKSLGVPNKLSLKDHSLEYVLTKGFVNEISNISCDDIKEDNPECSQCEHFTKCGGGCRIFGTFYHFNKKNCYSPNFTIKGKSPTSCAYYKQGFSKRYIELINKYYENDAIDNK